MFINVCLRLIVLLTCFYPSFSHAFEVSVPYENRIAPSFWDWFFLSIPGLDNVEGSMRIAIPHEELKKRIPGYQDNPHQPDGISGVFYVCDGSRVCTYEENFTPSEHTWPDYEKVIENGYAKIVLKDISSWFYVDKDELSVTDDKKIIRKNFLGRCRESSSYFYQRQIISCSSTAYVDGKLAFDYSVSEPNIAYLKEIRSAIEDIMQEWIVE